jgi:hypothetical protein
VSNPSTRFLLKALFVTVAVCALAVFPVRAFWGESGLLALAVAAGVALVGAALGRLPRLFIPREGPDAPVHQALATIGARLLSTAALALAVVVARPVPNVPFALCLVVLYLVLMGLEVREAIVEVARGSVPASPREAGGAP